MTVFDERATLRELIEKIDGLKKAQEDLTSCVREGFDDIESWASIDDEDSARGFHRRVSVGRSLKDAEKALKGLQSSVRASARSEEAHATQLSEMRSTLLLLVRDLARLCEAENVVASNLGTTGDRVVAAVDAATGRAVSRVDTAESRIRADLASVFQIAGAEADLRAAAESLAIEASRFREAAAADAARGPLSDLAEVHWFANMLAEGGDQTAVTFRNKVSATLARNRVVIADVEPGSPFMEHANSFEIATTLPTEVAELAGTIASQVSPAYIASDGTVIRKGAAQVYSLAPPSVHLEIPETW